MKITQSRFFEVTHPQSSASRARTFRPVHVLRNHATLARVIQIKTLVGRRMQANAASQRQRRRLHAIRLVSPIDS